MAELGRAILEVLTEEKSLVVKDVFEKDVVPSFNRVKSRIVQIGGLGVKASKWVAGIGSKISRDGIQSGLTQATTDMVGAAKNGAAAAVDLGKSIATALPEGRRRVNLFVDQFRTHLSELESDSDKAKYCMKLLLFASVTLVGVKQGHDVPDLDFKAWGAGAHRSFLSHSVAPLLVIGGAVAILSRVLDRAGKRLKPGSEAAKLAAGLSTMSRLFGVGFGGGLAFHLAVDGLWDSGGTIRIHGLGGDGGLGSLVSGTRIDDMVYTNLMALFSGEMVDEHGFKKKAA
jgi:hypothetical protein